MLKYNRFIIVLVFAVVAIVTTAVVSQGVGHVPNLYADNKAVQASQNFLLDTASMTEIGPPQAPQLSTPLRQSAQLLITPSTTITMTLQPGWNAIYLAVQPEVADTDLVLKGIPIRSVWTWIHQSTVLTTPTPVLTPTNAVDLAPGQTDWLAYFPPNPASSSSTNLFALDGGHSYLVNLDSDKPVDWVVTGQPVLPSPDWLADSYNLVGFDVDPTAPPTFATYFASAQAHRSRPIYRLAASGEWAEITTLDKEPIQPRQAYWVYSDGPSNYVGPLKITLEQGRVLDFGKVLDEQTLHIRNESTVKKQVSIQQPIDKAYLVYWGSNGNTEGWLDFPGLFTVTGGQELALRVAVRRDRLAAKTLHQSALEIFDGQGVRLLLPVVVEGLNANGAGLWVGTALINKVNTPADAAEPNTPKPTGSEFQFRLIVHVDATGQARLLQQVMLMWKKGTERQNPEDSANNIVADPGRFVLVTRDDLLPEFTGAAMRDGQPVGRRISSAAFSFTEPVTLTGNFSDSLQSDPIIIGYDDPLNPFKHKYHPSHDNLGYDFKPGLPEGAESYTVTRNIKLEFSPTDPAGSDLPGWGTDRVGGVYRETIQGVHKDTLDVEGVFRLQRVSTIDQLNDGR